MSSDYKMRRLKRQLIWLALYSVFSVALMLTAAKFVPLWVGSMLATGAQ